MAKYLLDASAILALLNKESGKDQVEEVMATHLAFVSAVNLSEVATKLLLRPMPLELVKRACGMLPIQLLPVTGEHCWGAAGFTVIGKILGLSLGDRFCLGVALVENAIALTADREWKKVKNGPQIELIR